MTYFYRPSFFHFNAEISFVTPKFVLYDRIDSTGVAGGAP